MVIVRPEEMSNPDYSVELNEALLGQYKLTLLKGGIPVHTASTYQKGALIRGIRDLKNSKEPEKTIMLIQ